MKVVCYWQESHVLQDLLSNFHFFIYWQFVCRKIPQKLTLKTRDITLAYIAVAGFDLNIDNKELPLSHQLCFLMRHQVQRSLCACWVLTWTVTGKTWLKRVCGTDAVTPKPIKRVNCAVYDMDYYWCCNCYNVWMSLYPFLFRSLVHYV